MEYSIGKSIKTLRQKKGMSQAGLGIALGLSRSQISNWELERRAMTLDDAVYIASYFNITLDELISMGK